VYYYTVNAPAGHEWSSAPRWPLPKSRVELLSLGGSAASGQPGLLDTARPAKSATADRFVVNYKPVCKGSVDLYFIMWPCVVENHGLSYASAPLREDVQIAGHPIADLWIAASTNDADVFVYLERITPSGDVSIVTHGRLRASLRSEQKPPYRNYMGLPYHRGNRADAQPLTAGEPARLRLDLLPTSTILKKGDRVRLTIAGADPRQRSRTIEFDPPPQISILHDREHPSRVELPVIGALKFEAVASR
jgi:putative CocE/NonD family hydrolase